MLCFEWFKIKHSERVDCWESDLVRTVYVMPLWNIHSVCAKNFIYDVNFSSCNISNLVSVHYAFIFIKNGNNMGIPWETLIEKLNVFVVKTRRDLTFLWIISVRSISFFVCLLSFIFLSSVSWFGSWLVSALYIQYRDRRVMVLINLYRARWHSFTLQQ